MNINYSSLISSLTKTVAIAIIAEIARHLLKTVISRSTQKTARLRTLGSVLKNTLKYIIWTIAAMMILSSWNVNIAPILAGAGVLGLAVGFGAQTLVKDMITGFFLLFENFLNLGDQVKIAGLQGTVVSVKLRTTILKDSDGAIHIIPNSMISSITKLSEKSK